MSKDLSRLAIPGTIAQAAQVLEHTAGAVLDPGSTGGVDATVGEYIRAEGVLWPAIYGQSGVNAVVGDAMLGICLRGPTDSLLLMTDPNGATYDPAVVPPLGADRQEQPAFPGKPRIPNRQPALVVKPLNYGVSVNNAALNVGEPLVTPHAGGRMGDYSRSLYDVQPRDKYANGGEAGSLDVTRYGALDSALVPRKVVPLGVSPGPDPDVAAAFNFHAGTRTGQYSGVGYGYFAAVAKGAFTVTPPPVTGNTGVVITGGRSKPTFEELQAWRAQGGAALTWQEALFDDSFQKWLRQYRASNPAPMPPAQGGNLPGSVAGRSDVDLGGKVPLQAYLANYAGGPIIPGFELDKHRFGVSGDGAVNPGTIATSALYGSGLRNQERFHAPLDFELTDEPEVADPPGTPIRVHLQYDHERAHTIQTAGIPDGKLDGSMTRPGLFRWHVRVPLRYPLDPPALPIHDIGRFDPPYFPPVIGPPHAGDGVEGASLVVIGKHRERAPMDERVGVPWLGVISGLGEVNTHGRPVYTYEPTINVPALEAADDDESLAFQARSQPGTSDGLLIVHPPELRPLDAVYGAVIPTGRRVSDTTLLLHRVGLAFGKAAANQASAVEGWRMVFNASTGGFDLSYYDGAGTLDATKVFTVNGSALGGGITALTGDVTASGSGSVAATIAADAVDFTKLLNATQACFIGATGAGNFGERTYANVRSDLGLVIGTNVQAYDAQLASLAALSYAGNSLKAVRLNAGETDFEFFTVAAGGDVVGPAASTNNGFAVFDGITGKLLKDHAATIALGSEVSGDLPFANLAQGSAHSVLGVTGNATADVASIQSSAAYQVMVANSTNTGVAFGAVNLAQSAAVTGILTVPNGGTGASTAGGALTNLGVSAFAQTIFDDADAAAVRATIGAGTGSGTLTTPNNDTTSGFTIPALGATATSTVRFQNRVAPGALYYINDATNTIVARADSISGSTVTWRNLEVIAGAVSNSMASGAYVIEYGTQAERILTIDSTATPNYQMTAGVLQKYLFDATGGTPNVYLPAIAGMWDGTLDRSEIIAVKFAGGGIGDTITINPHGDDAGALIDGAATLTLTIPLSGVALSTDGANWWINASHVGSVTL